MTLRNGDLGFWANVRDRERILLAPAPLETDIDADVVIVGGGYTGLWTALAIRRRAPNLRVIMLEAEHFGFGASGRNGGWLSAKAVGNRDVLASVGGRESVIATDQLLMQATTDIPRLLMDAGHDIAAHAGGWLQVARTTVELERCRTAVEAARTWGLGPERIRMIDEVELRSRVVISRAIGAISSPDNVRIDPMALVEGLCAMADLAGVERHAGTHVVAIRSGSVDTAQGAQVRARHVVVATEGYSSHLPDRARQLLPLNSAMIATRQLRDEEWERVGWDDREGIAGSAHTYFYGQRTPDGRIVIGGRGRPYRFGSRLDDRGRVDVGTVKSLEQLATDVFGLDDLTAEYAWCGVLGVARDWTPFIDADAAARVIDVGGYAGQGVAASKVAGDAVAKIIHGDPTGGRLPWVRRRPRRWELEPFRWIGANGLYRAYSVADAIERRTGRTSVIARAADLIAGR